MAATGNVLPWDFGCGEEMGPLRPNLARGMPSRAKHITHATDRDS
jgi:hypothetical protein